MCKCEPIIVFTCDQTEADRKNVHCSRNIVIYEWIQAKKMDGTNEWKRKIIGVSSSSAFNRFAVSRNNVFL